MVPPPVPALEPVRVKVWRVKVAVTVVAAETVTVQAPVPEHPPPLQPVKIEPAAGAAVRVATAPVGNPVTIRAPQAISACEQVIVPLPVPALETVRAKGCRVKIAVTV